MTIKNLTQPPTETTSEATITLTASNVAGLIEALEHCDEFLRTSSRTVRGELADYCLARPNLTSGGLIDTVSLTAYLLRHRLDEATQAHHRGTGQGRR